MQEIIDQLIPVDKRQAQFAEGFAFSPSNIALCKYWGKRDTKLNLPYSSSISISLGDRGSASRLSVIDNDEDIVIANDCIIPNSSLFAQRVINFLELFRFKKNVHFKLETITNIPVAAGVASSACGFAALTRALNKLYHWSLTDKALSIIARLGSGSACRSLWHGFVVWQAGDLTDGMDSHGMLLPHHWDELRIGLLIISNQPKSISSRQAMAAATLSSAYSLWIKKTELDFEAILQAIENKNFTRLGETAEKNAKAMHSLIRNSMADFDYSLAETKALQKKIHQIRMAGTEIYFTQDAGPNLKLLFLEKDVEKIKSYFPDAIIISPFQVTVA